LGSQFRKYFEMARSQPGVTGDLLLQELESRLDNVVYRLCFADSRSQARQFVNHGHFIINGRKVNIPSYIVKPGDIIAWKPKEGGLPKFAEIFVEAGPKRPVPEWLRIDAANGQGEILAKPEVSSLQLGIDARKIVEFYSR